MSESPVNKHSSSKKRVVTKAKRSHNKKGGWFQRHCMWLTGIGALVAGVALAVAIYVMKPYSGPGTWVYIPRGSDGEAIRDSLMSSLGESTGGRVYTLWGIMGGEESTAHGAYRVDGGEWAVKLARRISRGMETPVKVGWSDARTMAQLAETVTANVECSPEEFIAGCDSILGRDGLKREEYPAAFLPDTYEVYWSSRGDKLVKRLYDYRNRWWNDERKGKAAALGLTATEAATLASIVEEESGKSDERPKIARLYLNRLKIGMPLQADPTVKFAVGDFSIRRITGEHLKVNSDYNTYRRTGLPPGPIRIASKAGIESVLEAPSHDYLYMCAREDFSGYHNFACDYATHRANAQRYQKELNRRNIH